MSKSRYAVGIDLGTTNSALAFADSLEGYASVQVFKIPQSKAPGELVESELLPSFAYSPDKTKTPEGAFSLPWNRNPGCVIGLAARDSGCHLPARFIHSAKSWLCHPGIDRRAAILPWNSTEAPEPKSPVEVSRQILEHLRNAWDAAHPDAPLSRQELALTVPASFDEAARELTLEAAQEAGLRNITVLEEPLAAFYAWLDASGEKWREKLLPGQTALVIDVGGGTSDFSMISLGLDGVLSRGAAGDHLLLGGDNIDMAIAKQIETSWGRPLPPDEWSTLCQLARSAKEKLLGEGLEETKIALLSKGSSVVASSKTALVKRADVLKVVEEGFLPKIASNEPPMKRGASIKRMGLPYESDPAITRHLLEFLRYAAKMSGGGAELLRPDWVLFNGGALIPQSLRTRLLDIIASWFPGKPAPGELCAKDLSLAVAIGAAKALAARHGSGTRVRSGTVRSYYLEVAAGDSKSFVCVMPRGTAEGAKVETPRKFLLEANKAVSFPLWSAHARPGDKAGDELTSSKGLLRISSLATVVRRPELGAFEAAVAAELSPTGIMELSLEATGSKLRWPLKFDIRAPGVERAKEEIALDAGSSNRAVEYLKDALAGEGNIASLAKELEECLALPRREWPLQTLRRFADLLLEELETTSYGALREARLLNLCGFCLRPGIGDCADTERITKLWRLWQRGPQNASDQQVEAEWWVLWRRAACGLRQGQQRTIMQELWNILCPKGDYAQKLKKSPQVKMELWRCLGSLELAPLDRKVAVGDILAKRLAKLEGHELWVLGRLGARRLFQGPATSVVPAAKAVEWLTAALDAKGTASKDRLFAVCRLASLCGDRTLDLPAESVAKAKEFLTEAAAPAQWLKHLETVEEESSEESANVLGDSLPLGLKLLK